MSLLDHFLSYGLQTDDLFDNNPEKFYETLLKNSFCELALEF